MTFSQSDFPYIKWSLLTFLIIFALGSSAVIFTQKFAVNAQNTKRTAQQQLHNSRSKLNMSRDDQQNMSIYTKEYSAIQRHSIIGDEQRLNLIEELDSLRNRSKVMDFKYGIAPQQPYKPLTPVDSGNFDLKYSPMKVELELLHEGQFIGFFDSLH